MRRLILERAKFCCEYCHSPTAYSPEIFEVEHVIPTSRGGKTTLANLALACPACNRYKANRVEAIDPVTEQLSPLYNPRTQEWTVHFQWNKANERKKVRQLIRCQGTNKDEIFFKIGQTFEAMFKQSHSLLG